MDIGTSLPKPDFVFLNREDRPWAKKKLKQITTRTKQLYETNGQDAFWAVHHAVEQARHKDFYAVFSAEKDGVRTIIQAMGRPHPRDVSYKKLIYKEGKLSSEFEIRYTWNATSGVLVRDRRWEGTRF